MSLSGYTWCSECRAAHYAGLHRPQWRVFEREYHTDEEGFDGWVCRAVDAEDAAERYAEHADSDSAEYAIVGGRHEPIVDVYSLPTNEHVGTYRLTGEVVPNYIATLAAQETHHD